MTDIGWGSASDDGSTTAARAGGSILGRAHRRRAVRVAHLLGLAGSVAGLFLGATGCRVDPEAFEKRVFRCDTGAPGNTCGTDATGSAMACFPASQVGGRDFCAPSCAYGDGNATADGVACLRSNQNKTGIGLRTCKPSEDVNAAATPACGSPDLRCYRTDLVEDEGVCTTMNPCDTNEQCTNPVRSVCATTFLSGEVYKQSKDVVKQDHMFCLQTGCKARGTSCGAGESCLQDVVPAYTDPPDICVPDCDSNLNCPPNFLCYRHVSTAITPKVCIPGLLGFTCFDDMDCMVGKCLDTGIFYKVCTTLCATEADCRRFDGIQGLFSCIKNPAKPSDPGYCRTPNSFRGAECKQTADCQPRNPMEVCSRFNPKAENGICLLPCTEDGKCPDRRGGIKHTCLPSMVGTAEAHVCYPGYFGLPCTADENCLDDLVCLPTVPRAPSICTKTCAGDVDCQGNRWMGNDSWCSATLGSCQKKLDLGAACPSDGACLSGSCDEKSNTCVAAQ